MPRTTATDAGEQKLLDDIRKFGWHCINVLGDAEHEPFSYTIGLFQTYGHSELLIYGLPQDVAHSVLTIAADAAAEGKPLNVQEPTDALLEGYPCIFVPVPLNEYPEHVGFARWYYQGDSFQFSRLFGLPSQGSFLGIPMLRRSSVKSSQFLGSMKEAPNPSIERTSQGLRPCAASHVKR